MTKKIWVRTVRRINWYDDAKSRVAFKAGELIQLEVFPNGKTLAVSKKYGFEGQADFLPPSLYKVIKTAPKPAPVPKFPKNLELLRGGTAYVA